MERGTAGEGLSQNDNENRRRGGEEGRKADQQEEGEEEDVIPSWLHDEEEQQRQTGAPPRVTSLSSVRFTPITLIRQLYHMAECVDRVFTGCGVQYWTSGGTTLGVLRHAGIIPFDDDIDLCVMEEDVVKMAECRLRLSEEGYECVEASFGYRIFHKTKSMPMPFDYVNYRYPFCDVFVMMINRFHKGVSNEVVIMEKSARCLYEKEKYDLRNLKEKRKRMKFGLVELYVCDKAEEYLSYYYGSDWKDVCYTPSYDHVSKSYIQPFSFPIEELNKHIADNHIELI